MWKWIKGKFVKRKGVYFSGFRVEIYRDGTLMSIQLGHVDETITFHSTCGPIIINGVRCNGYTLTPHLESIDK